MSNKKLIKKLIIHLAIKALKGIPEAPANFLISAANNFRLKRILNRRVPVCLTFFITNRCNAACEHCFYWKEICGEKDEISTDDINKLSKSLKGLKQIILTGGEPFLRNELVEICQQFSDIGVKSITIPTNGILTNRITEFIGDIIKNTRLDSLKINVSLDGMREIHDSIRNVAGCHDKALETILKLKELGKNNKNLVVSANTTISHKSHFNLKDFIQEMNKLNIPLMFSLVRGTNYNTFGVDLSNKRNFNPRKEESLVSFSSLDRIKGILKTHTNRSGFVNWNIFQQLKFEHSIEIIKNRKRLFECLAGRLDGIIYNNGDVSICELTRPIGNLKDFDMDFKKLWWSDSANKMRDSSKNCCCIHGCNLLSSMQYDVNSLKRIIRSNNGLFQ